LAAVSKWRGESSVDDVHTASYFICRAAEAQLDRVASECETFQVTQAAFGPGSHSQMLSVQGILLTECLKAIRWLIFDVYRILHGKKNVHTTNMRCDYEWV
jgi:hypothetical protein